MSFAQKILIRDEFFLNKTFTLFTLSNLVKDKAVDFLLDSFSLAVKNDPCFFLYIGGSGPELSNLKSLSASLGLNNNVNFLGELNRSEVAKKMNEADVYIHPSDFETFGVVLIEAMSTGTPVITTNCGGPEEFINKNNGIKVNKRDINGLSTAISEMKLNFSDYRSEDIRNYVISHFSEEAVAKRLIGAYDEVVKRKRNE